MESLRALRYSRSLTILDISRLTGIPARALAEAEYGLRRLSTAERETLSLVFGLATSSLTGAHRRPAAVAQPLTPPFSPQTLLAAALVVMVAAGALQDSALERVGDVSLAAPRPVQKAAPQLAAPLAAGALAGLVVGPLADAATELRAQTIAALAEIAARDGEPISPALLPGPPPAPTPLPHIAAPAFALSAFGPLGCPLQPPAGQVVLTQGYGVGSHAPAAVWGAVDLAVDADGDGYAEPGSSWYTPVVATHDGRVRVTLDSYPAGNHVWVFDPGGVWRTGYSHLALVTVTSDQFVRAGEQIGLLGSSGLASGPHLDYQVWQGEQNIDPTGLVGC